MKTKLDICGNTPMYGDFAAFNPPYFKGLRYGENYRICRNHR